MSRLLPAILFLAGVVYADPSDAKSIAAEREQIVQQIRTTQDERRLQTLMLKLGQSPGGLYA